MRSGVATRQFLYAGSAGERASRAIQRNAARSAPIKAHTARRTAHSYTKCRTEPIPEIVLSHVSRLPVSCLESPCRTEPITEIALSHVSRLPVSCLEPPCRIEPIAEIDGLPFPADSPFPKF